MFLPIPEEVLDDLLADKKQEEENILKEVIEKKGEADVKKNVAKPKRLYFFGFEKARLLQFNSILTRKAKDFFVVAREIVFDHPVSMAQEWLKQEIEVVRKYMAMEEEEEVGREKSFLKGFAQLYRATKLLAITRNAIESFSKSIRTIREISSKYTLKDLFESKQKREEFINELKSRWADILDPVFFGIKLSILTAIENIFSVILPVISGIANALIRAGVSVVKGVRFLARISYRSASAILRGIRDTALYRNLASRLGRSYIGTGARTALQRFGTAFSGIRTAAVRVGESTAVRAAGSVFGAMGTGLRIAGRAANIGFSYGAGFFIDVALGHSLVSALERNKFSLAVGGTAAALFAAGVSLDASVFGAPVGVVLTVAGALAAVADTVSNLRDEAAQAYQMGMKLLKGVMNAFAAVTVKSRVEGVAIYDQYYSGLYNQIGFNKYLSILKEEGGIYGNYYYQLYRVVEWVKEHLKITFDQTAIQEYKSGVEQIISTMKENMNVVFSKIKFEINIESTADWIIKTVRNLRERYSYKGKLVVSKEKRTGGWSTYRFTYNGRPITLKNENPLLGTLSIFDTKDISVPPEQNLDIFGGSAFKNTKSAWVGQFANVFKPKFVPVSFNDYQDVKIQEMEKKDTFLSDWAKALDGLAEKIA